MKFSTLAIAAFMTLSVAACSSYKPTECNHYPREHYEAWQEDCRSYVAKDTKKVKKSRSSSFNSSLSK